MNTKILKQKILAELLTNDEWKTVKLGDVGHWQAGTTPSRTNKKYYEKGIIPWLKTGDLNDGFVSEVPEKITELAMQECRQLKLHPKGSVAIALYGATIGKCGIFDIETTTNQACLVCRPNELTYNIFLFYFLVSKNDYFKEAAGGGAQPNISKDIVIKTEIPLPPLSVQKSIVNRIERLFAEIDRIETARQVLLQLVKTAKQKTLQLAITGELTNADTSTWKTVKLGEVCELVYGNSLTKQNRVNGNVPVFGSNGQIGTHNISITEGNTIIIGRKGSIGEVHYSKSPCWVIDTAYYVKIKCNINTEFLYMLLGYLQLNRLNKATAIPGLNRDDVYEISIPLPPLSVQQQIVEKIERIFTEIETIEKLIRN